MSNKKNPIRFAILTVSDRCVSGERTDESGPLLETRVTDTYTLGTTVLNGDVTCKAIVQDDEALIMEYLTSWSDGKKADVILTTGGTGLSERDVTPEATKKVITKEVPGMSLAMLKDGLDTTPMAMLSRAVCGVRNKTLIINLPGSRKGAIECLNAIISVIPHAVDIIQNNKENINDVHTSTQHSTISIGHSCLNEMSCKNLDFKQVAKRHRQSPYPMISVDKALALIRKHVEKGAVEVVNVRDAFGRILYKNAYSECDIPPFRASVKDGYAVLASDGIGRRRVIGSVKAGDMSNMVPLKPGTCIRVNTGAAVPSEATAVVQVEDTKLISETSDSTEEIEIEILVQPKEGQDIRPIGSDVEKGSLILHSYTSIGSSELGLLVSCGCEQVTVSKLPSVGILSTGDELQELGEVLAPGRVYDSNRITLLTLLKEHGYKPLDLGIVSDDLDSMVQILTSALEKVDVLVTTGSVSMGDRDMLKPILQEYFKATIHFGRVNMKPGKPTTFATCKFQNRKKFVLCLPGNPVSATVTAHLFLLPLLSEICYGFSYPTIIQVQIMSTYQLDSRPEYARAIVKWNREEPVPLAWITEDQSSSRMLSCRNVNALLMLPSQTQERTKLVEGDTVHAMLIGL